MVKNNRVNCCHAQINFSVLVKGKAASCSLSAPNLEQRFAHGVQIHNFFAGCLGDLLLKRRSGTVDAARFSKKCGFFRQLSTARQAVREVRAIPPSSA